MKLVSITKDPTTESFTITTTTERSFLGIPLGSKERVFKSIQETIPKYDWDWVELPENTLVEMRTILQLTTWARMNIDELS